MQRTNKDRLFNLILTALFAAICAICSWLSIPMPTGVAITLQTFGIALTGFALGYKYGLLSVIIYVALGAVGVPVFSGFKGGIGIIAAGPSGGFIIGFIFLALLCGLSSLLKSDKLNKAVKAVISILLGIIGLTICHLFGIFHFMRLYNTDFTKAAIMVSVPYIIKDVISVALAYFVAVLTQNIIGKARKSRG